MPCGPTSGGGWRELPGALVLLLIPVVFALAVGCGKKLTPDGKVDPAHDPHEAGRIAGRAGLSKEDVPYPDDEYYGNRIHRREWLAGHTLGRAEKMTEENDRKVLSRPLSP